MPTFRGAKTLRNFLLHKTLLDAQGCVQCFVGSRSGQKNLELIPKDKIPRLNALKEEDREYLFLGLEQAMPKCWQDKIWEMLWQRWQYYESVCNQK